MKRDGLIIEFFELLPKVKDMRSQLVKLYTVADKKLAVAMVADGKSARCHSQLFVCHCVKFN
jgi:vacuolar-type H+-ATPase subunit D/Vma8